SAAEPAAEVEPVDKAMGAAGGCNSCCLVSPLFAGVSVGVLLPLPPPLLFGAAAEAATDVRGAFFFATGAVLRAALDRPMSAVGLPSRSIAAAFEFRPAAGSNTIVGSYHAAPSPGAVSVAGSSCVSYRTYSRHSCHHRALTKYHVVPG